MLTSIATVEGICNEFQFDMRLRRQIAAPQLPPKTIPYLVILLYLYTSMRHNADGSWYIEALTDALNDYGDKKDIKNVLMIVNDIVSKYSGVIVNSSGAIENGNVKQMPKQEYTLRKNLKFKRNKR
ncbi:hypothetical protein GQR58_011317 [Nymphon striatum]|nr:hypothetical protein GQR58_011317 [Nymphon striatum]